MKYLIVAFLLLSSQVNATDIVWYKTLQEVIAANPNTSAIVYQYKEGSEYDPLYMHDGEFYLSTNTEVNEYNNHIYNDFYCYVGNGKDLVFKPRQDREFQGVHSSYKVKVRQVSTTEVGVRSVEEMRYYNRGRIEKRPFSVETSLEKIITNCNAL